jgi:MFS family permease
MGWWSMTTAGAPALGLIIGGPLIDVLGWRIVFVIQAVMSAGALVLAAIVLQETRRHTVRFDLLGAAALTLGVGGLMAALGSVRELGIASPWVQGSIVVGVCALAAFLRIESHVREPLLPPALLRNRSFSAMLATNALNSGAYMGALVIAPLLLYESFGLSITTASLLMALRTASLTGASLLGGSLGERMGERFASAFGGALMAAALGLVAWSALESSLVGFCFGLVGQGVGHGLSQPSITAATARTAGIGEIGVASAVNRLAGQGGAAFGIAALTIAYGGVPTPRAFGIAFALGTALAAVSALTALGMLGRGESGMAPREIVVD